MSQYNKTVLTNAGLELAKRANAGQAKFEITRAVTSADDWSNKTIQDLEEATAIPNIMQQGTIMDAEEVESNNSVIGVSLCFTNKNLSTGYQIRIIGLYVKEEGQENDFLYAVTTAATPEYMPSFADKVLYRFNMQMYLVIGNAQSVNVVINDGTAVTHGQLDKYKAEVTGNLKKLENTHKEDMSHVAKSASINGGAEILPDSTGKLNLVVPDPDLSKYVSLEQLTEMLQAKADITAVPNKTDTEEGIRQAKAAAKTADDKAQNALDSKADKTDVYTKKAVDDAFNTRDSNITNAVNLAHQAQNALDSKADKTDVYTKKAIDDAFNTRDSNITNAVNLAHQAQTTADTKANSADVYTKSEVDIKTSGTIITAYDIASKTRTRETNSYRNRWLVDQGVLTPFADQINQLKGRRQVDTPDFNTLTDSGVYFINNTNSGKNLPPTSNWGTLAVFNGGNNQRIMQIFSADDGTSVFTRIYGINGAAVWGSWNQMAWTSDINSLQSTINQQNQTIQSLTTRLTNAENEIRYIKDNYIEGKRFPASQEAQAEAWENEKPTRLAMIEK
ncbi:pyocin knob domain-containing protein [Lactobacillus helveticus]|uniref:pyocin knob domain-containing protein n=1 Tax=Lactobacillus helveticus TaxID=1587 RepID=UPI0021A4BA7B|nr:pyocin knob domain-containing protein [Lactobacillus helveticus]